MCTRVKHGKRPVPFSTWPLPLHAIDYCLPEAGMRLIDVDHVACFDDPFLVLGRKARGATMPLLLEPSRHLSDGRSPRAPLCLSSIVNASRQPAGGALII